MKVRSKRPRGKVKPANSKKRSPLGVDPSRTSSVRKAFQGILRKRFGLLKGRIVRLLVEEDSFGLKGNAFCPTGPGGGVDPTCSPSSGATSSPHLQRALDKFEEGLGNTEGLSGEQYDHYLSTVKKVLGKMGDEAVRRVAQNVRTFQISPTLDAVTETLNQKYGNHDGVTAGAYDPRSGSMYLDGGEFKVEGKTWGAEHVYAHELGHAIDGPSGFRISDSQEWKEAWEGSDKLGSISQYAKTDPAEGFAEFSRLLYAGRMSVSQASSIFPKAAAVWQKHGLLPKEPTSNAALDPDPRLPELFSKTRVQGDLLGDDLLDSVTVNAFCPTGPGGGVDPSCSPNGVGFSIKDAGGGEHRKRLMSAANEELEFIRKGEFAGHGAGALQEGVKKAEVFGSFAGGKERPNDVDILLTVDSLNDAQKDWMTTQVFGQNNNQVPKRRTDVEVFFVAKDDPWGDNLREQTRNKHKVDPVTLTHNSGWDEEKHPRDERGRFGSSGSGPESSGASHEKAQGILSRYGAAVSSLVDRIPVVGHVKRGVQAAMVKVKEKLANRYGDKAANVIMASGSIGGYGVMALAIKTVGFSLPIVTDIISIAAHVAVAEGMYQLGILKGKKPTVNWLEVIYDLIANAPDGTELTQDKIKEEALAAWEDIAYEVAALLRDKKDELEEALKGEEDLTANASFSSYSDPEKITAFQDWLREQYQDVGLSDEGLWQRYAQEGYQKGAGRAFEDADGKDEDRHKFLQSLFGDPVSVEKVKLLAGRSFDDLEGVTADMSLRMSRALTDGLVQGSSPQEIAKDMNDQVDIGSDRAETIARTEIIRVHSEGQLDAFEQMGVEGVGVAAEWATADDEKVCPMCDDLTGVVLTVDEARGLLPRHPNCRCTWLPAGVGEGSEGQVTGKRTVEKALESSVESEGGKTDWAGADLEVSRRRPPAGNVLAVNWSEHLALSNVFCSTGTGGGVDPTCSPGGGPGEDHPPHVSAALKKLDDIAKGRELVPFEEFGLKKAGEDDETPFHVIEDVGSLDFSKGRLKEISPRELIAGGDVPEVYIPGVREYVKKDKTPPADIVVYKGGYYIIDGHHKAVAALLKNTQISVRILVAKEKGGKIVVHTALVSNMFCPTGTGGGVDPHCGREERWGKEIPATDPKAKFIGKVVGKAEKDHADSVEKEVARTLGGEWETDNKFYDVKLGEGQGPEGARDFVEVKTILKGDTSAIKVHNDALLRKVEGMKEHPDATYHTVAADERDTFSGGAYKEGYSGNRLYYQRGCRRQALSSMHPVKDMEELKRLIAMKDSELPDKARGSLPKGAEAKALKAKAAKDNEARKAKDASRKARLKAEGKSAYARQT